MKVVHEYKAVRQVEVSSSFVWQHWGRRHVLILHNYLLGCPILFHFKYILRISICNRYFKQEWQWLPSKLRNNQNSHITKLCTLSFKAEKWVDPVERFACKFITLPAELHVTWTRFERPCDTSQLTLGFSIMWSNDEPTRISRDICIDLRFEFKLCRNARAQPSAYIVCMHEIMYRVCMYISLNLLYLLV